MGQNDRLKCPESPHSVNIVSEARTQKAVRNCSYRIFATYVGCDNFENPQFLTNDAHASERVRQ